MEEEFYVRAFPTGVMNTRSAGLSAVLQLVVVQDVQSNSETELPTINVMEVFISEIFLYKYIIHTYFIKNVHNQ
jgi:hypothetical protein